MQGGALSLRATGPHDLPDMTRTPIAPPWPAPSQRSKGAPRAWAPRCRRFEA